MNGRSSRRAHTRGLSRGGLLLAVGLLLFTPGAARCGTLPLGTYEYRLSWNGIPAARATIAVSRRSAPADGYRVEGVATTNWFTDLLWSLRARVASDFTAEAMSPRGFVYDRKIRGESFLTEVAWTPGEGATGSYRRGDTLRVTVAEPDAIDPVTAIFRALSEPLALGQTLRHEVFTGESRYLVELAVQAEETVNVAGRTYEAWRLEPRVWKIGQGREPRLRGATIWVSKGAMRIVLRVRGEVYIGSVHCDLVAARPQSGVRREAPL